MTEPETEIDTLDRLEAALQRIASHGASQGALRAAATRADAPEGPSRPDGLSREEVVAALDRVIVQLKDALASIGEAEQE